MNAQENQQKIGDDEILEKLKMKYYEIILSGKQPPKVGDLLKIIELQNKLKVSGEAEKKFWDMINKVREKGLSEKKTLNPKKKASK